MKSRFVLFETFSFLALVSAVLYPVWSIPQLLSLDAGVHIYNSRLIKSMLLDANHWGHIYYNFTSFPIPNWFGHALSIILLFFMDSIWAMKVQLLALMFSFAFCWRWVLIRANIQNIWASHFGVLMIWSWFILLGFHNFLWGVNFAMIGMAISLKSHYSTRKLAFKYFGIFGLLYFSHPTLFLVALTWIGLYRIGQLFSSRKEKTQGLNGLISLFIGSLPWFILLIAFIFSRNSDWISNVYLSLSEKVDMIQEFSPLLLFNGDFETPLIYYVLLVFIVLLVVSFFLYSKQRRSGRDISKLNLPFVFASTILAFSCLIGFFILPDSTDTGSFISVRILYLTLIFTILLLTYFIRYSFIFVLAYLVFIGIQMNRVSYYTGIYKTNAVLLNRLEKWGSGIEPGSLLVCINEGPWFFENLETQLSLKNDIVCIENFEAVTGYFPLFWKVGKYPVPTPEEQLFNHKGELLDEIDYVLWIRNNSDVHPKLDSNSLELIESYESYFLFRWQPNGKY